MGPGSGRNEDKSPARFWRFSGVHRDQQERSCLQGEARPPRHWLMHLSRFPSAHCAGRADLQAHCCGGDHRVGTAEQSFIARERKRVRPGERERDCGSVSAHFSHPAHRPDRREGRPASRGSGTRNERRGTRPGNSVLCLRVARTPGFSCRQEHRTLRQQGSGSCLTEHGKTKANQVSLHIRPRRESCSRGHHQD